MKEQNSKIILGSGDYEIGAELRWKFPNPMSTFHLTTLLIVILISFTSFYVQYSRLSSEQQQLDELRQEILKLQSQVQSQSKEIKELKKDLDFNGGIDADTNFQRTKRSYPPEKIKDAKMRKDLNHSMVTAAHLEKSVHFYKTDGVIKGWNLQHWSQAGNITLENQSSTMIVAIDGIYMIYAQLCYTLTSKTNGFEIKLINPGTSSSLSKTIAQCRSATTLLGNEVTCYTSVLQMLKKGSKIQLQQIEKDRSVFMDDGRSFMGIVKMSH